MSQIKQAFSWWCFAKATHEQLLRVAAEIGYQGVELAEPEHWPLIKAHGLTIVSTKGDLLIERGLNRRERHEQIEREIRSTIAQAEQWGIPNIIVFSGNRAGLSDREGAEITAEGLSRVAKAAEEAGVTLAMELLNSKINREDYQCDRTAWGVEVVPDGEFAAREAALRHLPHADHGGRYHAHHPRRSPLYRTLSYSRQSWSPRA
jgi:hydroxypyruvate isomerase